MSYSLWMWIRNGVSKANIWNSALLKIFLGGVHFVPLLCGLCFVQITFTFRDHGGKFFLEAFISNLFSVFSSNHFHFQGSWRECLLNSLDIFTFVVNPMLPPGETFFKCLNLKLSQCSALTANNAFAQKRLQKEGIYCLHTKHINLCGGIDVVAFDKVRKSFYLFYWDKWRQIAVLVILENWKRPWLWSFWSLAQLAWDDQTIESHNLLEWVTKVDLSD